MRNFDKSDNKYIILLKRSIVLVFLILLFYQGLSFLMQNLEPIRLFQFLALIIGLVTLWLFFELLLDKFLAKEGSIFAVLSLRSEFPKGFEGTFGFYFFGFIIILFGLFAYIFLGTALTASLVFTYSSVIGQAKMFSIANRLAVLSFAVLASIRLIAQTSKQTAHDLGAFLFFSIIVLSAIGMSLLPLKTVLSFLSYGALFEDPTVLLDIKYRYIVLGFGILFTTIELSYYFFKKWKIMEFLRKMLS